MNPVIITLIINAVSFTLGKFGIQIANAEITTTVQTLVLIITSVWAILHHNKVVLAGRAAGAIV